MYIGEYEFREKCIDVVYSYVIKHLDKTDKVDFCKNDIYVVWMCKILQNNKALLSTNLPDGMYYEITYNGDKQEFYIDAYKKIQNFCIKQED